VRHRKLVIHPQLHDAATAARPGPAVFLPVRKESPMKLSPSDAALLSPAERELVEAKGPWHVKDLVRSIERTRRLRDKSRDLLQRQTISKRRQGKGDLGKDANARSGAKVRVFERALENFQKQLAAIDADSSSAMSSMKAADKASKPGKRANPMSKKAAARKAEQSAGKKSATKKSAGKKSTAKKGATSKAPAKKAPAKKTGARKSAAGKSPASKGTTGNAGATSKSAAGSARKATAKSAKPVAAKRAVGPRKLVSDKARRSVVRNIGGPNTAQTNSLASRATRASKSRRGG
jgi:hypothetical protein